MKLPLLLSLLILTPAQGATLNIAVQVWGESFSPGKTLVSEGTFVEHQIYEALLLRDSRGTLVPNLLDSWHLNDDRRVVSLHLRPDVRFSNGSYVEARDVVQLLQRLIRSEGLSGLDRIEGAVAFRKGTSQKVAGIEIVSRVELKIKLVRPYPAFLLDLASFPATLYRQDAKSDRQYGTGPYQLTAYDSKSQTVILQQNPFYTRRKVPYERVLVGTALGPSTDISFIEPTKQTFGLLPITYVSPELFMLGINSDNSKLADRNLRRMLSSALSLPLARKYFGAQASVDGGLIPTGIPGHTEMFPRNVHPSVSLKGKSFTLDNYLPQLAGLADDYCKALEKQGARCTVRTSTGTEMAQRKRDSSLELYLGRRSVSNLDFFFVGYNGVNLFMPTRSDNRLTSLFSATLGKALDIPYQDTDRLIDIYKELDRQTIDEALGRPLAYIIEKKLWVSPRVSLPTTAALGLTQLKLVDVSPRGSR